MKKTTIFFVVFISMVLTVSAAPWKGVIATAFSGGDGTATKPYLINTPDELAFLAQQTNLNALFSSNKYYKLSANIDLGNQPWTPIGTSDQKFCGNLDGDNFSISNILIESALNFQGLFGFVGQLNSKASTSSKFIIKNISISTGSITGCNFVAGIVGRGEYLSLQNCTNSASIKSVNGDSPKNNGSFVAGIIGGAGFETRIEYCSNAGSIAAFGERAGGIVGQGAIGGTDNLLAYQYIKYCFNTGSISGTKFCGGIAGTLSGFVNVDQCFNNGIIKSNVAAGGIIGYGCGDIAISNCYNTAAIFGLASSPYSAGIIAFTTDTKWFASVTNCYNTGVISPAPREAIVGQLVESPPSGYGDVSNCYFLAHDLPETNVNGGIAQTEEQFKDAKFLKKLGKKTSVWSADVTGLNNGFPILTWQLQSMPKR
jgi:hypothetical protein